MSKAWRAEQGLQGAVHTNAVQAQGIQELAAPQLGSQGRHIQQRRVCLLHRCPRNQGVHKVQLGAPQEAGESVLGERRGQRDWR